MVFTWNATKRRINRHKHGLDFADAEQVFAGPTLTHEDPRVDYDEQRFNSTGLLGAQAVVITHTETEDTIHVISMREAQPHEIKEFFSYL
jgi:hypothetical protein